MFIALLASILAFICLNIEAAPTLLLRLHLQPAAYETLAKQEIESSIAQLIQTPALSREDRQKRDTLIEKAQHDQAQFLWNLRHLKNCEFFLMSDNGALFWATIISGDYPALDDTAKALAAHFTFVEPDPDTPLMIGYPANHPLDDETQIELLNAHHNGQNYPFLLQTNPSLLLPQLEKNKMAAPFLGGRSALLTELKTLTSLELRAFGTPEGLRLIAVAKARPGSALHTLFNQRLGATLPLQHRRMTADNSFLYGYALLNPSVVSDYLKHYEGLSVADTLTPKLNAFEPLLPFAEGYTAFVFYPNEKVPHLFLAGRFNATNTPDFLRAAGAFASMKELRSAFRIGDAPVWKADLGDGPAFFALSSGSLLCAPTAERLTNFVEALRVDDRPTNVRFDRAFVHYPTVCLQARANASLLWQTLSGEPTDTPGRPLYLASSISSGQMALTLDLPGNLTAPMQAFFVKKTSGFLPSMVASALTAPPQTAPPAKPHNTKKAKGELKVNSL